jgi:hypothetical protein
MEFANANKVYRKSGGSPPMLLLRSLLNQKVENPLHPEDDDVSVNLR